MYFPPTSRYFGLATKMLRPADGVEIAYLSRRFVPLPERFATIGEHTVQQGERPDHIAFAHLQDPEQFWRIADANAVLQPEELTVEAGRRLRITLPEGIPGPANA